ncbi:MAG TPA: zinc chelation protein SecC [Fluviicoccus sp.]|nr:zinc chelation protein SecC [Fluviicoccus sp.]
MNNILLEAEALIQAGGVAASSLSEMEDRISLELEVVGAERDTQYADQLWRLKTALGVKHGYMQAFAQLKAGDHYNAWCILERCEIDLSLLVENSDSAFHKVARTAVFDEYIKNWQSLYPYKIFFSPGFLVGFYTCSICGEKIRPSKSCGHRKKRLYGGKICFHIGHDLEPLEVSIVTRPVQKYSIPLVDYDYSLLNYVIERLDHAFEPWKPVFSRMAYPRNRFNSVSETDPCPCKTGSKSFGECCSGKEEVEIPHVDFHFMKKLPEDKQHWSFPYEQRG